jgi:hypothetical protein
MSYRIKISVIGLAALVVWAASCSEQPPTASDERSGLAPSAAQADQARNGISGGVVLEVAQPGRINFDPPCNFVQTLPLQDAPYMNPATRAFFARGWGAVLNQCSGFSVTGYSRPNFLAWNCQATNFDGTRPALPAEIHFLTSVSEVSVKVGSATNAGSTARLVAFDASLTRLDGAHTTLAPGLKTLSVSAPGIRFVRLMGPCIMVADDFRIRR